MLTFGQAILLGLMQGMSELFPVSSLGHSVIVPTLLGWQINQSADFFLVFLVATHLATAMVLFLFFWKDWLKIIRGLIRSFAAREIKSSDHEAKLAWLLVIGTIPAGALGLLFQDQLKTLFASPVSTAFFLMLNGCMLFGAEALRRRARTGQLANLSWPKSVVVGASQAIALFPGFSRTGSSMAGGLLVGLTHEEAAKFSFLLATPVIAAAALLKLPDLLDPSLEPVLLPILVGAVCAGVAAYFSVRFLTKYFKTDDLTPFAVYCLSAGAIALLIFFLQGL